MADDEENLEGGKLSAPLPLNVISHITIPSSLPGSFASLLRLIQQSSSTAAALYSSSTWKQQKLDFILIFAAGCGMLNQREQSKVFEL